MHSDTWKKGWLNEVLSQAEKEVQSWPDWMKQPELRYPLTRHGLRQSISQNPATPHPDDTTFENCVLDTANHEKIVRQK